MGHATPAEHLAHFARNLKRQREQLRLSQDRVGYRMHRHGYEWGGSRVSDLERQIREPKLGEAAALAEVLDIPIAELIGITAPAPAAQPDPEPETEGEGPAWTDQPLWPEPPAEPAPPRDYIPDTETAKEIRAVRREVLQLRADFAAVHDK